MSEKLKSEVIEIMHLIEKNGRSGRLGKIFNTEKNHYYYDTGTGKVAKLNTNTYLVLKCILESDDSDSLLGLPLKSKDILDAISEIKGAIQKENILQAPPVKTLTGEAVKDLEDILENGIENVTLEVTEKCNLRCKYCIYNPSHPEYREFGHRNMRWDVAKKAIDFLKNHSKKSEHRHIGFYGGEPLLNYQLIKDSVEYAKSLFGSMTFALTTNATLVNDEIANFFASNDFNLIISLDGPEKMHDANRVMINGEGSFDKTIIGCKKIFEEYQKQGKTGKIGFNMVVSGPDYKKQYDEIQHFIKNTEWIPEDVMILTATVDRGPAESEYYLPQSENDREFMETFYEPLFVWEKDYKDNNDISEKLFSDGAMDKGMLIIHKRLFTEKPIKEYGMNGCCVPGQRRIYVTVDGTLFLLKFLKVNSWQLLEEMVREKVPY